MVNTGVIQMKEALRVVIGSGASPHNRGWLHTEESELNLLHEEKWSRRFRAGSLEAILAEHVWEHLTYEEGVQAARNIYPYLSPGGYIRCAVPDGYFPDEAYQNIVQVGGPGPLDHPAASHRIVHNYITLRNMFIAAGYEVKLLEYCDASGHFHYNQWDEEGGFIYRSKRFDHRNTEGKLGFVSLIVDAVKA
jgi:predicted SAM-dependent methyltransferase